MAPIIQSLSFGSDSDNHFVLCTLKVPIPKSYCGLTLFNMSEGETLLADIIKNELVSFMASKDKQAKRDTKSQIVDTGSLLEDSIQEMKESSIKDSSAISEDTLHSSNVPNSDQDLIDSPDQESKTLCSFSKERSTDSSMEVSHTATERSPPCIPKPKEEKSIEMDLTVTDDCTCIANGDSMTVDSTKSVVKEQLGTWDLSKQEQHIKSINIPASSCTAKSDVVQTSNRMEGVQLDSSWSNFIDLVDSFGLEGINTDSSNLLCSNSIDFSYRNLNRYHSSSSSSGGSDLDWSFDGIVQTQDCDDSNYGDTTEAKPDLNEHNTLPTQDNLDFQSILAALSGPADECTTETIHQILQQETQVCNEASSPQEATSDVGANIRSPDSVPSFDWKDTERQLYQDLISLSDELDRLKKKTGPRKRPNQCYHLWDFLRDELDKKNDYMEWVSQERREFRILDTKKIAHAWGNKKRSRNMNYDKLSRSLRYYCKLSILEKVPGKRLHFKFGNGKMWTKV